jgi:hypothetical protein
VNKKSGTSGRPRDPDLYKKQRPCKVEYGLKRSLRGLCKFSFGEEKLIVPLIATPIVENANRRQKKSQMLNYKQCAILLQKGIVFFFANYLEDVLVWNYTMGWFK